MILINTTFAVDPKILSPFMQWVRTTFTEEATATVGGTSFLLTKVMPHAREMAPMEQPESELTYALQFRVNGMDEAKKWMDHFSLSLMRDSAERWGSSLLQFTTLMEIVEL